MLRAVLRMKGQQAGSIAASQCLIEGGSEAEHGLGGIC